MRKLLSLILVLTLVLGLCACAAAVPEAPAATDAPVPETSAPAAEDLVILYTNDVHTYIDGVLSYDVIAALKQQLQEQYGNVLLVDAGDHIQGTAFGSMDKGETVLKLMNAAGYDLAILGNHEFDYGIQGALDVIGWAEFPYISCNFYHEKEGVRGDSVLDPTAIFELGGQKIAFVGITTPESFTSSTPASFQDEMGNYIYGISGGEDGAALFADVQAAIDSVDADIVIALGHMGDDPATYPWNSQGVIANVTGLDAFIDGHSHSRVPGTLVQDKDGQDVLLTQTGEYFDAIGIMHIDGQTGEITSDLIGYTELTQAVVDETGNPVTDEDGQPQTQVIGYEFASTLYNGTSWCSDAEVKAMQDQWIDSINTQLGQPIGSTVLTLDNYDSQGNRLVRSQETNTGDFGADALYYLFDNMGLDVDAAILNGGGVRNKAITGEITYLTAKTIHTFGNVACLQTVTGLQLLDALEWGARSAGTGEECGGFLQVAGITYKIDSQWPSSIQEDEKGVWIGGPTGGYRVWDVQVFNKDTGSYEPLDLNATYNLAGYNYTLREMGDGFNMFSGSVNVLDYVMEDYMVLTNYIQGFPNALVDADNSPLAAKYPGMLLDYGNVNGSGRILFASPIR